MSHTKLYGVKALIMIPEVAAISAGKYLMRLVLVLLCAGVATTSSGAQTPVRVDITGLDSVMEANVRLFLSIEQQEEHRLLTPGRLQHLHRKAKKEISAALQPYGYYRPVIDSSLVKSDTGAWRATYTIDLGPPLQIAEFNFTINPEMAQDAGFTDLLASQTLQAGNRFNHLEYEEFKEDLAKQAAERGYFDAKFIEHRVEIDLETYAARIYLNYAGGKRYHFGEVVVTQDVLSDDLLRRLIPFARGDPYTLAKLAELQQVLNDTFYFQTVELSAGTPQAASNEIPIEITLTPRERHYYEIGAGYGTDTGARASFNWLVPLINQRGHRFNTNVEASEKGHQLRANYRVPVFNPRTDQIVYSIGEEAEDFEDTDSTLRTIGVSLIHSRGKWRETLALNYRSESFVSGSDEGDSTLLVPGVSWSRTWGRDFINALDGLRFDLSLRGASEGMVSDTDFGQLRGKLKFITSLNSYNRIIARGEYGGTSVSDFSQLPSSLRFFSGGAQSVRGYRYQSLGPTDDDGKVIGGKHLVFGSIEFEHYFNERWGIAIFGDIGNAIDDLDDALKQGAGLGIRWKSPVGPVRLDLASAISDEDESWRLHINIGPDL
ncbi:MAG: outer membrane protein assembly factor [Gammaproteobacteria bacterium]|nr:outer membrane protein assembly factor [Gammaproteobacteria bacterium]